MTDNASIITPFVARPETDGNAWLLLEQQEYSNNIGKVTMLDIIQALSGKILATSDVADVDCGINSIEHSFATIVHAYPYPESLAYHVGITHGNFAMIGRTVVQVTQTLSFSLDTTTSLKYPVKQVISTQWLSDVYAVDGSKIAKPVVTRQGQDITIESPVYGTLVVVYTTMRDVYRLSIKARLTAVQNVYQSVFYGYYDGGIKLLEVDPPENAEENYGNGIDCTGVSGSGSTFFDDGGDEDEPTVDAKNIEVTLDYCEDFGND